MTGGHQTGGDQRLPGRSKLGSLLPPMEEISKEELPSLCWNSFLRSFRVYMGLRPTQRDENHLPRHPAKAGVHCSYGLQWVPAFAGMT